MRAPDDLPDLDTLRSDATRAIAFIEEYYARVERLPVRAKVSPGEIRARMPARPPEHAEPFERILRDTSEIVVPGLTHWQSPKFFAYFSSNTSTPSMLGELVAAALNVQGMLWATSPACTELEALVMDWIADMLDLPASFRSTSAGGGVLQDSGSSSMLCALLAARERATLGASNRAGMLGRRLAVFTTAHTHSSLEKGARVAGLGSDAVHAVDVDASYAMRPDALRAAIASSRRRGESPCMVVATVGTTSSTAIDPVRAIGGICREEGVWLHVDAAMCGAAALCPELRFVNEGLDLADSYSVNPHKWMLVNVDASCLYVRDRASLTEALAITPEYLRNTASCSGAVIDYRDWQVPLARRFRALKVWFVIRRFGVAGLRAHVREHVRIAQELARRIAADEDFELAAPAPLSLVCFRHRRGDDAFHERLLERLNDSGEMYLSHTRLDGKITLRIAVGQRATRERHVLEAWDRIRAVAREMQGRVG